MAKTKDEEEIVEIQPQPQDAPEGDAVKDPNAESDYGDRFPDHTALIPQPGEKGAPDSVTHFKVINAMVSVPHVFKNVDGSVGITGDAKYHGEIVPREVLGSEEHIAQLLGLRAIEPVKV